MDKIELPLSSTRAVAIADWVRSKIIDGDFLPDTHIQEQVIAAHTGTSRTPVREALKLLEREDLVLHSANRGYVVRRFSLQDILDALEVRANLEGLACRLVAERGLSSTTETALSVCLEEMNFLLQQPRCGDREIAGWIELNFEFHGHIIAETSNRILANSIVNTQRLPLIFDSRRRLRSPSRMNKLLGLGEMKRSLQDHYRIVDAVLGRESARAESLMREHVRQSAEAIKANFQTAFETKTDVS